MFVETLGHPVLLKDGPIVSYCVNIENIMICSPTKFKYSLYFWPAHILSCDSSTISDLTDIMSCQFDNTIFGMWPWTIVSTRLNHWARNYADFKFLNCTIDPDIYSM